MTTSPNTELLKFSLSSKNEKAKLAAQNKQFAGKVAYENYKGPAGHIAEGLDKYNAEMRQDQKGRRKHGWEYALEGLTEGMSTGLKMSAEQEKIARVMGYFQEVGDAAGQQNAQYQKKAAFTGAMAAPAKAAVPLLYSDKPYEQVNPILGDLWNSAKLNNKELQGDYIGFVPNTPNIIVRGADGKEQVVSLNEYAGNELVLDEYEKSLLRKAEKEYEGSVAREERSLNVRESNAGSYAKDIKFRQDVEAQGNVAGAKKQAQQNVETAKELETSVQKQQTFLNNLDEMEKIIKDSSLAGTGGRAGLARYFAKAFNLDAQYAADSMDMLSKEFFGMAKDLFGARVTNMDLAVLQGMIPTLDKNPQASLDQIKRLREKVSPEVKTNLSKLQKLQEDIGANIHTPEAANIHSGLPLMTPEEQARIGKNNMPARKDDGAQQSSEGEQMVPVFDPNGVPGKMPLSKLKEALNDNYTLQ